MLYLLWTILNIVLLLFFIIICFQATKLIREKLGLLAAAIFAFGLFSFVSNSGDKDDIVDKGNIQIKKWRLSSETEINANTSNYQDIIIEKTLISTIHLGVSFGKARTSNKEVPMEANSSLVGFVGGHTWKPILISVDTTAKNDSFAYKVIGSLQWKLLGTTIYSQRKEFSGFMDATLK